MCQTMATALKKAWHGTVVKKVSVFSSIVSAVLCFLSTLSIDQKQSLCLLLHGAVLGSTYIETRCLTQTHTNNSANIPKSLKKSNKKTSISLSTQTNYNGEELIEKNELLRHFFWLWSVCECAHTSPPCLFMLCEHELAWNVSPLCLLMWAK